MAIEETRYLSYADAVLLHIELMRSIGEPRYGAFERSLVESALARPIHAAHYEGADLIRQAASLCLGLIKNHPWVGGNKRTATAIVDEFLLWNSVELISSTRENIEMVRAVEADRWKVDEIEAWLRQRVIRIK